MSDRDEWVKKAMKTMGPMMDSEDKFIYACRIYDAGLAARAQQSGEGREDAKERLREAISEALGEALDCTRVWEAWGYGTMSQDDFQPVNDDPDRLEELVDAALSVLPLPADKPEGEWVKCSERLPTEDDADALRQIWIYSDVLGVLPLSKDSFSEPPFYTHWMPTGLTRPAAPDMGGEK